MAVRCREPCDPLNFDPIRGDGHQRLARVTKTITRLLKPTFLKRSAFPGRPLTRRRQLRFLTNRSCGFLRSRRFLPNRPTISGRFQCHQQSRRTNRKLDAGGPRNRMHNDRSTPVRATRRWRTSISLRHESLTTRRQPLKSQSPRRPQNTAAHHNHDCSDRRDQPRTCLTL